MTDAKPAWALRPDRPYVPAYEASILGPRAHRYCLAIFVIDEGDRLITQLESIRSLTPNVDIVIADGGSTDGSTELGRLRDLGVRALLVKRGPGRLSAQMLVAMAWALQERYDGLIVMDGNGKDDPRGIEKMRAALERGADHVQGSRYIAGGRGVNTPPLRYLGVRLLHAPLVSLAAGHRYTDTTNGFRGYSAGLLSDQRVRPFRPVFDRYQLHYYLAIKAARLGFRVVEVPLTRTYPASGSIPTKITGVRAYASLFGQLLAVCLGRYDPPGG